MSSPGAAAFPSNACGFIAKTEAGQQVRRAASRTVVKVSNGDYAESSMMTWLIVNALIMIVFFALWTGVPAWMVLKHPDARS